MSDLCEILRRCQGWAKAHLHSLRHLRGMNLSGEGCLSNLFAYYLSSCTIWVITSLWFSISLIISMMIAEVDVQVNLISMLKLLLPNVWQLLCMAQAAHPASCHHIMHWILLLFEVKRLPTVAPDNPGTTLNGLESKRLFLRFVVANSECMTHIFKMLYNKQWDNLVNKILLLLF